MASSLDRWIRMWSHLSRRRLRGEVDEELEFHLEMLARKYEGQGMDPAAARRAAEERFGDPGRIKKSTFRAERSRVKQRNRAIFMDNLLQDLRFAFRQLWKRPVFSGIALAMLALGIGANTAIFSVVYTVLLRPLPFHQPDQIVRIWESRLEQGWERASVAPGNFWDFREMNRTFDDLGAYRFAAANLTGTEHPEQLSMGRVTSGFFGEVLGVRAVLGRTFLPGEDEGRGEGNVVVLGNEFWHSQFGGDPSILDTQMTLDGESYTVVGVLPPGRPWLDYADVYAPMIREFETIRTSFELAVIGRLRDGTTLEGGQADLEGIAQRLEETFPEELAGIGVAVGPSSEWVATDETRRALWVLLGVVGFLLMIACVNLANIFLARATGRVRETAIRAATGASKGRLIRQGLTESLVVSLLGAGLGLALASWGVNALIAMAPGDISGRSDVTINGWVLAFTLGAGVLTGVVTGLVPALQASGADAASTLRAGGQSIAGNRAHQRLRGALVAAEVALSLMLLVGSGLLIRSFGELIGAERGFESENRLIAAVNVPDTYGPEEFLSFNQQLLDRANALTPVEAAALVHIRPLAGGSTGLGFVRPDQTDPEGGIPWASWRLISPGYFETIGVPILRGRDLNADDLAAMGDGPFPTLISERIAEQLWPGEDPLGRTITLWAGQNERPGEIIGVVGDMLERGIDQGPTFAVYLPYFPAGFAPELVVHTAGAPTALVPTLRSLVAELDPNIPLSDIATMEDMVGRSVGGQRFIMVMVSIFAGLALILALAGVYGVQSYAVAQQTPEIGVRVAIGASKGQIMKKVIFQAMRPAMVGVVVGLGGAFALSRLMESLLFQVRTGDPMTYAGVAGLLVLAALFSAWLPALRATRVDPVIAFRTE
ncbi:MAG: ABC transporter permease [Gemmatimonadetes bacterium]|nr:ABC transporter permease [Gemmatimonadota bacterium]